LKDEVNWYFEEGASINNTVSAAIFLEVSPVVCNIVGYGNFSSQESILDVSTTSSNILFQGINFTNNSNNMFEIGGGLINIRGVNFTNTGTSILNITGDANVRFIAENVNSTNSIAQVSANASGQLIVVA